MKKILNQKNGGLKELEVEILTYHKSVITLQHSTISLIEQNTTFTKKTKNPKISKNKNSKKY